MSKGQPYKRRPRKAVDGQTHWAKRKRQLAAAFTRELGRQLSTHEQVIVANCAAISVKLEQFQQDIVNGKADSDTGLVVTRLNNTLRRLLGSLGWDQTRKVRGGILVRKSNGAGSSGRSALDEHLRNRRRNAADKTSGAPA